MRLCKDLHFFPLVLDSTAKIADGIIEGNFNNPGNQLECNAINVEARNSTGNVIHKFKYVSLVLIFGLSGPNFCGVFGLT